MTEREEFEEAYRVEYPETCRTFPYRFERDKYAPDEYENGSVHVAWVMWQAARRTMPDREAWISVDERLPPNETGVLLAVQFDHANDWRIKVGGLSNEGVWTVFGASWTPSHWMHLPTAPNGEKEKIMNYCPPPEPPMVGEYIQNFGGEPSGWMQARKCRDGSWVVNSIGKDGKVIGTITIPAPEQDKK